MRLKIDPRNQRATLHVARCTLARFMHMCVLTVQGLRLDGALSIRAVDGASVVIRNLTVPPELSICLPNVLWSVHGSCSTLLRHSVHVTH